MKKFLFSPGLRRPQAALLLAGGLTLVPALCRAEILAYEGFDYASGSTIGDQNGGVGWSGSWTVIHPNGGSLTVSAGNLLAGGNAPAGFDALSKGRSANLVSNYRDGRLLDTNPGGNFDSAGFLDENGRIGATGKTLYFSFLQQADGTSKFYEFELHRDDLGDLGRIAGIGNDLDSNDVNLRAPSGTHTSLGPGDTEVNFYIVRIDFQDGNDDIRVYRNPTSATEPAEPTLTLLNQADMSFNGISLGAFLNSRQVAHDEVRFGETWADMLKAGPNPPVAPAITQQPYPVTSYAGGTVVLNANVTGTPAPAVKWFQGTTEIPGATSAQLTLSNIPLSAAGDYKLVATNSAGTATSDVATVKVLARPDGLIAYEGFDYASGSNTLGGHNGGLGWGAPWQMINNGSDDILDGSLAAGPAAPAGYDTYSLGNQAYLPTERRDGRFLDTTVGGPFGSRGYVDDFGNIGADGKTLYFSFLQQPNGTAKFYEMEFHRGDLGDFGRIGGIGNDLDGDNVNLRAPNGTHTLIGPGSTDVNFYVVRIDYKGGNDDVRVWQNPTASSEPAEPTLTALDVADMSFNGLSMGCWVNGRTVAHDELRLGETWAAVVPGSTAVTPYTQWVNGFTFPAGADKTPAGDPDGDSLSNLLEFGFGLNPTAALNSPITVTGATITAHGAPALSGTNAADLKVIFGRRKDFATAGLTYTVQFSADLTAWQDNAAAPSVLASDAEIDAVSVPWTASVPTTGGGTAAARFFRVKVISN